MSERVARVERNAFTLVELLVVIAVITILAGLLLPALSSAKQAAMMIACLSNQKQMGVVHHSYAGDYREFIDYTWSGVPAVRQKDWRRKFWNGVSMWEETLPRLRDGGYVADPAVGYCSLVGRPDANGHTDPGTWPNGWYFRMDHDAGYWGNPFSTALTNQGDFSYYGPGTNRYDWEHWSNKELTPIWMYMKEKTSVYPGHLAGVRRDGRIYVAHSNEPYHNSYLGEHQISDVPTGARTPLMMDSFMTTGSGVWWWGGSRGPHAMVSSPLGAMSVLFNDGSAEKWDHR